MNIDYAYDDSIRLIDRIEFGVWSNEDIRENTCLDKNKGGIELSELYDNQKPKADGLNDTRLGVSLINIPCSTCGLDSNHCIGHFGHIELGEPVHHYGFINWTKKMLGCICLNCSKVLIKKNEMELEYIKKIKDPKTRLAAMKNHAKNVKYCSNENYGCGAPVTKVKIDVKKSTGTKQIISEYTSSQVDDGIAKKGTVLNKQNKAVLKYVLTPDMCFDILNNISDDHLRLMGITPERTRPKSFIHKIYPYPPMSIRPSAKVDFMDSQTKEDDITSKMHDIVKANNRVVKNKDSDSEANIKYGPEAIQLLSYHIRTNFDNESSGVMKSEQKSKSTKSIRSRIKGKEGRIRGNLMGKRVEQSARSVISPDPCLSMDQVRVPIRIAKNLTYDEYVTPYNIDKMRQLVKNGMDIYPGANYVIPANPNMQPITLQYAREKVNLQYGDKVKRHLVNNDITLFNRQPSLHKLSMMAHRIHIVPDDQYKTLAFQLSGTTPYNADFDGDEMNMFPPLSIATRIELEEIPMIDKQIISPKDSFPIIGIVQDGLLGSFNMTDSATMIDVKSAMNMLAPTNITNYDIFAKGVTHISGIELFSQIIPNNVNVSTPQIEIVNGNIIRGRLNNTLLAPKKNNSLVHLIYNEYGHIETKHFLDNAQKLVNMFNSWYGSTIGISDTFISKETKDQIDKFVGTHLLEVNCLITEMETNFDMVDVDVFEQSILAKLVAVAPNATKIVKEGMTSGNNFLKMIMSGARGSDQNIQQISVLLGQQLVETKRIQKKNNNRSLAYFPQNDDTPLARGFVDTTFTDGVQHAQFIYHNMGAREGLIDTAVKTAETGYLQRKLVKLLEDLGVVYDCTVRKANTSIIQFIYGSNGNDTTKQILFMSKYLEMSNKEISAKIDTGDEKINALLYKRIIKMRDTIRHSKLVTATNTITFKASFMLCVNIHNIIKNIIADKKIVDKSVKMDPMYVIDNIERVCNNNNTSVVQVLESNLFKQKDSKAAKTAFRFAMYECLSPNVCLVNNIGKNKFDTICERIIVQFNNSVVEPGEMVGVIAAQSIGEPTTQMTLSSFHSAGVASAAALGVPRVKELFSITPNLKTPEMKIIFKEEVGNDINYVKKIASQLSLIKMKDVRNRLDLFYDPSPLSVGGIMEKDNVYNVFYGHSKNKYACQRDVTDTDLLMRIEINKEKMIEKDITLLDIKTKFCHNWEKRFNDVKSLKKGEKLLLEKISSVCVLSNTDNDNVPVIHIRFKMFTIDLTIINNFIEIFVDNFKIKGVYGINKITNIGEEPCITFDKKDGSMIMGKRCVVYTSGVNMKDIRYIKGIDLNRTLCNDVVELHNLYDIDAFNAGSLKEYKKVFEGAGSTVNNTHLKLLVDMTSFYGFPIPVDRHQMKVSNSGTLAKASFENTMDHFINAAVFGETDNMKSLSARIMTGMVIKGGTGLCNIILDTEKLLNSEYTEDFEQDYNKTFNEVHKSTIIDDAIEKDNDDIFVPF